MRVVYRLMNKLAGHTKELHGLLAWLQHKLSLLQLCAHSGELGLISFCNHLYVGLQMSCDIQWKILHYIYTLHVGTLYIRFAKSCPIIS